MFNISSFFTLLLIFITKEILKDIRNFIKKKERVSILIDNLKCTIMLSFLHTFVLASRVIMVELVIIKKLLLMVMNIIIKLDELIRNFVFSSIDEANIIYKEFFSIKN